MDKQSVLSLNGPRVAVSILRLVPDQEAFREALRLVKLWAKRRCIYSNCMGFLGGVAWSILIARICQLYPKLNPAALVKKFFRFCRMWRFGWDNPIQLCDITEIPELGHEVWNPFKTLREKFDLMPIITPAYPAMNSAHNIAQTAFAVLQDEFARGDDILSGGVISESTWESLLEKKNFFAEYKDFLQVKVCGFGEKVNLSFQRLVEARIRGLVRILDTGNPTCKVCPNPSLFSHTVGARHEIYWFIGIEFQRVVQLQYNLSLAIKGFQEAVWRSCSGGVSYHMTVDVEYLNEKRLPHFVINRKRKRAGKQVAKKKARRI